MMKKKLLAVFCAGLMAFSAVACGSESSKASESNKESESSVKAESSVEASSGEESKQAESTEKKEAEKLEFTSKYFKLIGRTKLIDDILWFAYSGSGVEFNFKGKSCELVLRGDTMATKPDTSPRYAVYVDGEIIQKKTMDAAIEKVMAVNAADVEEHVIKVLKISEAAGCMSIMSVNCDDDAEITPTAEKQLKIEFIGDSITCGYGVDGKLGESFAYSNEDCTKAYAYKTAQKLDADYSLVAASGHGIISGYSGDGNKVLTQLMPDYYDKLGNGTGTFLGTHSTITEDWDFSGFTPDIVVINLGTNDASYTKGDPEKIEDYTIHYCEFLKVVREKNPKAKIVCVLGVMGQDLCPALEDAVNRTNVNGDEEVYYLKLDQQGSEVVVDYHPTEASHEHAADQVSEFIKTLLK